MRVGPVLKPLPLHVIDIPSSFNLLLGRPWLHENMTVSSTTLQCEKFPYRVNSGRGASRLSRSRKRQNSANLLRLRSCQVLKASTGKAVQQYNGSQIRIGSERKANGTTGEAWDGIQFILFFSLFSNSYKSIKERSCSERRVVWSKASRCDGYGLARRFHV